jgi:2-methylisocitrate lyase-like PEP mutase family enzyme
MIQRAGFEAAFMTGFGVAAVAGHPDTGLLGLAEMASAARTVCAATSLPVIADGDTGYGNAINIKHTVRTYAAAGVAGIMIEDQVMPKRCGHTRGKAVVERAEALSRVRAACDARDELGEAGPLVMARTDARAVLGLDEALERAAQFREAGADITFLEAPQSVEEMEAYCTAVPGHKMANMLANGLTPELPPERLAALGFTIAAYPLDLLNASIAAYERTLSAIRAGGPVGAADSLPFAHTQAVVGFKEYWAEEAKYGIARVPVSQQ